MQQANAASTSLPNEQFNINDYFGFRTMITLKIIQVMYIVIAVFITLGALFLMFKGEDRGGYGYRSSSFMPGGFFTGLLVLVLGNVIWRIWCELMIVIFRINRSLNNIDRNTTPGATTF